jgi:putative glutamine amidotransferase
MKPVIGITNCLDDRGRWRAGRDYVYTDLAYVRAVEAAGGLPLLLPPQAQPEALLDRIDGLLLPGGDDFLPTQAYPESVRFEPTPAAQLEFDGLLLDGAEARGLPVLGICYGMQALAVRRGGSLHYHLPHDLPEAQPHTLAPGEDHALRVESDSCLAEALGRAPATVNSLHHQAVRDPGPRLRVSARAPDGVVEAVEAPEADFCMGVQWHPERQTDAASQSLFRSFVAAGERWARMR